MRKVIDLVQTWSAVETAYQHQAIAKNKAAFEAAKRATEAQVRAAKAALDDR